MEEYLIESIKRMLNAFNRVISVDKSIARDEELVLEKKWVIQLEGIYEKFQKGRFSLSGYFSIRGFFSRACRCSIYKLYARAFRACELVAWGRQ